MSDEHPIMLDLEPGTCYCCSCGKTHNQAFCDGWHENAYNADIETAMNMGTGSRLGNASAVSCSSSFSLSKEF